MDKREFVSLVKKNMFKSWLNLYTGELLLAVI